MIDDDSEGYHPPHERFIRGVLDVSGEVEWHNSDEGFSKLLESLGDYPKLQITSTPMEENMSWQQFYNDWDLSSPDYKGTFDADDTQEIGMVDCPDCGGTGEVDLSLFRKRIVDCVSCIDGKVTEQRAEELRLKNRG